MNKELDIGLILPVRFAASSETRAKEGIIRGRKGRKKTDC